MEVLTKRRDFLAAARGRRDKCPGFILQARKRDAADREASPLVRVGFTCSKKVGNAVARNRAKRRLREITRLELPSKGVPGWDYVLIGMADRTASYPFEQMRSDLRDALARIHRPRKAAP